MGLRLLIVQKRPDAPPLADVTTSLGHVVVQVVEPSNVDGSLDAFDVALIEVDPKDDACVTAAETCRRAARPVVLVSPPMTPPATARLLAARPRGVVLRPFVPAQLDAALAIAAQSSEELRAAQTLAKIADLVRDGAMDGKARTRDENPFDALSERERVVVERLLEHDRVPRIAERLGISTFTVRNHLKSIFRKVDVSSQQELLDLARATRGNLS